MPRLDRPTSLLRYRALAEIELRRRARLSGVTLSDSDIAPGNDETFRVWCERLAQAGLKVDGHPFTLANRPALHAIYDLIPADPVDAYDRVIVLRKGAQMGLTVWEVLADIYMAMKWSPVTIGMYVPDSKLAPYKSTHRFMRLVRSIPELYRRMTTVEDDDGGRKRVGEGNVLTRTLGDSRFLFLWTSGATLTESFPADVVSFDEVQNMTPGDISKVQERMGASRIRLTLLLSTPLWPDADIDFWYQQGTQHRFFTDCDGCGQGSDLSEYLPERLSEVIALDAARDQSRYRCPHCHAWIDDTQRGAWRATYPERQILSYHLSQVLSPTITAGQILKDWRLAQTGEQRRNFFNRKLGRPYADPTKIPVTLEHLNACVAAGVAAGVVWKTRARDTFMGIDQMGGFNAVLIKERLPDGRQALIHAEAIFDEDPFARCDVLMDCYGVACCVVEGLPNWNDAKRFANRHPGRVFVASYGGADTQTWGDLATRTDRKTDAEERDRWTVNLNQYKAMQVACARITSGNCLFPDPVGIECEYRDGVPRRVLLLREIIFEHLTRVALISERDPETSKWATFVKKIGIDPHYAYANMLCDVAWARAYGSGVIMIDSNPDRDREQAVREALPGIDPAIAQRLIAGIPDGACGACSAYADGQCAERLILVRESDPGCALFLPREAS